MLYNIKCKSLIPLSGMPDSSDHLEVLCTAPGLSDTGVSNCLLVISDKSTGLTNPGGPLSPFSPCKQKHTERHDNSTRNNQIS